MMGILKRTADVLRANMNDLLDKAEDAEKMLNQFIADMKGQLEQAKNMVTASIADEKRLKRNIEKEEALAEGWASKAVKAVERGEDDLAREALKQKWKSEQAIEKYRRSWEQQKETVQNLKDALNALKDKLEEAKKHKGLLLARERRSRATKKIHETMTALKDKTAFHSFQRVADKIEGLEFESEAAVEVSRELDDDETARRLDELSSDFDADGALQELKEKLDKN